MAEGKRKKLIYVSEELLDRLARIAYARGESLSRFVDKVLASYIAIEDMGYSADDVVGAFRAFEVQRRLGAVFLPQEALRELLGLASDPDRVARAFREAGRAYGLYIRAKFGGSLSLARELLEMTRWDLNEAVLEGSGKSAKLVVVSSAMDSDETRLMAEFAEGLLEGLGYAVTKREVARGVVALEAERREG